MSACVESLFYVSNEQNQRFVPWHGLGTPVENAPSSEEAIRLAGLDWEVHSKPIYDALGNPIEGYYANTRTSDNSVLGVVGNRYQIIQNKEAFAFTDNLLGEGVVYETAGSLSDGKKVWLLAKMEKENILGDDFVPYLCFTNTFDGSGAVRVCLTPVRVVCNNTLNFALDTARRCWSARHTGNIQGKLAEARETLGLAKEYMTEFDKNAYKLAEQIVTDAELEMILDKVFPVDKEKDSHRKIENATIAKNNFFTAYDEKDISQFKGTAYGALNAIADMVDHYAPTRMTTNYQENNWGKIMNGHPTVDKFYNELLAIA